MDKKSVVGRTTILTMEGEEPRLVVITEEVLDEQGQVTGYRLADAPGTDE